MQTTNRLSVILLTAFICSSLISCSTAKVRQRVLMPANSDQMKNVKNLAVVGFTGDKGNKFSARMENFFASIRVKNDYYFKVIDQASLSKVVRQQNAAFSQKQTAATKKAQANTNNNNSGLILSINDPMEIIGALLQSNSRSKPKKSTAARTKVSQPKMNRRDAINIAKKAGADTIITGSVNGPHFKNTAYKEQRSVCAEEVGNKCKRYVKKEIGCVKQQGKVNFIMKAVNINNAKITFSRSYSGVSENRYCQDDTSRAKTSAALLNQSIDQAIAKTRNDVAPYFAVVTIELMEKDNSNLAKLDDARLLHNTGLRLAKNNKISEACTKFLQASQRFGASPAILHNLGVCAEIKNELDKASSLYSKAGNLSKNPNKLIDVALARVNKRRMKNKKIDGQLR